MGILFLVATPIGNLEDISPRALRILREVDLIAAEDTRVTRKLLTHFDIHTPLTSYFEHNKLSKLDTILALLNNSDVALVSDAGTPVINDPGYELTRAALNAGHTVSPVPGPSAPLAALSASGIPADTFLYLGYLPRKSSERQFLLKQVERYPFTLVFLESPHRLLVALKDLDSVLGNRQVAIARELTKMHEEIWRGSLSDGYTYFTRNEPRGEFTLVISGSQKDETPSWSEERVLIALKIGLKLGETPSVISGRVAQESGWKRRDVYRLAIKQKGVD